MVNAQADNSSFRECINYGLYFRQFGHASIFPKGVGSEGIIKEKIQFVRNKNRSPVSRYRFYIRSIQRVAYIVSSHFPQSPSEILSVIPGGFES